MNNPGKRFLYQVKRKGLLVIATIVVSQTTKLWIALSVKWMKVMAKMAVNQVVEETKV